MAKTLIIGVGHPDRGDDAVGRIVAQRLRRMDLDAAVVETDGEAAKLLDLFENAAEVIVIDAGLSGAPPGTIHRLDAVADPIPQPMFVTSSHAIGLAESIELSRTLGTLPARCVIYAIEGESFDLGAPLSVPVAEAVDRVVESVLAEFRVGAE